jgi:hypothetical protein
VVRTVIAAIVLASAVAGAEPKAPMCAPQDLQPRLHYTHGTAVVCWGAGDCLQLGATEAERLVVSHPTIATPTPPQVKTVSNKPLICMAATCKPLGKKLAAALGTNPAVATTDARTVVIDGNAMWDVAKDRLVTVKPPKSVPAKLAPFRIEVLDTSVVAVWNHCTTKTATIPADCYDATLLETTGALRGEVFRGDEVVRIDAERLAIIPDSALGSVTIVAAKTGKRIAAIELSTKPVAATAVMLGATDLGVLWSEDEKRATFTRIAIAPGKLAVTDTQHIAECR